MTSELAAASANFAESKYVNVHWSVWPLDHVDYPRLAQDQAARTNGFRP